MFEFYLRDHGLLFPNGIGEEFVQFLGMHQEITSEPHVVTPALDQRSNAIGMPKHALGHSSFR